MESTTIYLISNLSSNLEQYKADINDDLHSP
jgi:hypothetical protein